MMLFFKTTVILSLKLLAILLDQLTKFEAPCYNNLRYLDYKFSKAKGRESVKNTYTKLFANQSVVFDKKIF